MEFESDEPVYESPLQAVISNHYSGSFPLFNPLTPAMDSTNLDSVRMGVFLDGAKQTATPGFQFSDDGVTFSSPTLIGSYNATQGWNFQSGYTSTFSYSPKNFVRFGVYVLNSTSLDQKNRTGQAKVSIQFKPLFARTLHGVPRKVNTLGSTANAAFHPLTDVVPTAAFDKVRRTLELATTSGDMQLEAGYQITNTPDDDTSWGTAVAFGSVVNTATISFGTTFSTLSLTKRFARFGVLAKNINATSTLEACVASMRVDLRYAG